MSILVNGGEHREAIIKAAVRRHVGTTAQVAGGATAAFAAPAAIRSGSTSLGYHGMGRRAAAKGAARTANNAHVLGAMHGSEARRAGKVVLAGATVAGLGTALKRRKKVEKSLATTVGRDAKRFKQGAKQGLKLAAKGHTHTGQIGTGVAGKPTFSVRPGTAMSRRIGVHAGVAAGNAPTLAAGAAVGAAAERHHVRKGLRSAMVARTVDRSFKAAGRERALAGELHIKSVPKRTTPLTGPGSARRQLDPSAAATRDAADRRAIGKSAFGVDL